MYKRRVQDLIDKLEDYRTRNLIPKKDVKSRLTPKEQEEDVQAMSKLIERILKYNNNISSQKRSKKNARIKKWRHSRNCNSK